MHTAALLYSPLFHRPAGQQFSSAVSLCCEKCTHSLHVLSSSWLGIKCFLISVIPSYCCLNRLVSLLFLSKPINSQFFSCLWRILELPLLGSLLLFHHRWLNLSLLFLVIIQELPPLCSSPIPLFILEEIEVLLSNVSSVRRMLSNQWHFLEVCNLLAPIALSIWHFSIGLQISPSLEEDIIAPNTFLSQAIMSKMIFLCLSSWLQKNVNANKKKILSYFIMHDSLSTAFMPSPKTKKKGIFSDNIISRMF